MLSKKQNRKNIICATYGSRAFTKPIPKFEIPKDGIEPEAAYQIIHDELNMDGNPVLNLASFVTTWVDDKAEKLMVENLNKNFVDQEEYPQAGIVQERVVNMLANLCNAGEGDNAVGTATIGSSEAIMLGLLAHKKKFMNEHKNARPNLVIGADVHVVWEKFARYFDVDLKLIPMKKDRYTLDVNDVKNAVDENTMCVGAVLGTTFTGQLDPIEEINDMLVDIKKKKGWDIPIHVDAASGGFVIPFLYPELKWDFRLSQVRSINISGHKYGLVYPGIGWLLFKDRSDLPEDLIFYVNYLGSEEATYTLNFSKGSAMIIAQYYNLLRLGVNGYQNIMQNCLTNAKYLAKKMEELGYFNIIPKDLKMPVIAATMKKSAGMDVFTLSEKLRQRGWIVPAYTLPKNAEGVEVIRIVVKENFSRDLADILIGDMKRFIDEANGKKTDKKQPRKSKNQIHNRIC